MTIFESPRFPIKEIEDANKLSPLLENAFRASRDTAIQNNVQVRGIEDQVRVIEEEVVDIVDTMGEGPSPDAIVTSIDLTATAGTATEIYTLPTGNAFIRDLFLVGRTASGAGDDPLVSLGISTSTDVALPQPVLNFTQSPVTRNVFRFPLHWSSIRLTELATLSLHVGTASTRSAFSVDAYLYLGKTNG